MMSKKKSSKKAIIGSIVGILAVALAVTRFAMPQKTNYTEVKPAIGNLATYSSFSGSVEAKNRQTVYADKAMQIKDIKVTEGQQVSPDTVLMTTVSGEEIKPEITGEVSSIDADVNAQLMPGAKLIEIVDYSDLQLAVQVDENDLAAVSTGKEASVTIHALNKDVSGKITDVAKEGTYQNGFTTFGATISLAKDSNLRVGMSAEAKVLDQSVTNVVILPMSAIQFDDNNNPYVLLKDGSNIPKQVGITLGINDGVHAEIKSGVTANDIVLVPPVAKSTTTGFGAGPQTKIQQGTNNASQGSSGGSNGQ